MANVRYPVCPGIVAGVTVDSTLRISCWLPATLSRWFLWSFEGSRGSALVGAGSATTGLPLVLGSDFYNQIIKHVCPMIHFFQGSLLGS